MREWKILAGGVSVGGGGVSEVRVVDVVDGDGVGGDDFPHLLDLCLEGGDVVVVALDGGLGLAVLLLQHLLLRRHALQLLRERLCGGLELLPAVDQLLQFQLVLEERVLLDLLLALQLLPVLAQLLQLRLLAPALRRRLLLGVLRVRQLVLEAPLHVLCGLALAADRVVLLLQLPGLPAEFLAGGLRAVVQQLRLCDLGGELVQDHLVLHE